jgi:hypothetical protein
MFKRKHNFKTYYTPGLISLLVIPALFIYLTTPLIKKEMLLDISLWNEDWDKLSNNRLKMKDVKYKWKYTNIELNDNQLDNQKKLDFAQIRIREIVKVNDTLNGVHFIFNNNSTYGNFVSAINICKIENARIYWIYKDEMWVFNYCPYNTSKSFEIPIIGCDIIHEENINSSFDLYQYFIPISSIILFVKNNTSLFIVFLALIFFTFIRIKKLYF